jgi:hypothetical protein
VHTVFSICINQLSKITINHFLSIRNRSSISDDIALGKVLVRIFDSRHVGLIGADYDSDGCYF